MGRRQNHYNYKMGRYNRSNSQILLNEMLIVSNLLYNKYFVSVYTLEIGKNLP